MDILAGLKTVVGVIDQMIEDHVIDAYALGGATAANIYIQSFNTRDFDFFVHLAGDFPLLDPLRSIIDYLEGLGYTLDGVEFSIAGQPVLLASVTLRLVALLLFAHETSVLLP